MIDEQLTKAIDRLEHIMPLLIEPARYQDSRELRHLNLPPAQLQLLLDAYQPLVHPSADDIALGFGLEPYRNDYNNDLHACFGEQLGQLSSALRLALDQAEDPLTRPAKLTDRLDHFRRILDSCAQYAMIMDIHANNFGHAIAVPEARMQDARYAELLEHPERVRDHAEILQAWRDHLRHDVHEVMKTMIQSEHPPVINFWNEADAHWSTQRNPQFYVTDEAELAPAKLKAFVYDRQENQDPLHHFTWIPPTKWAEAGAERTTVTALDRIPA